MQASARGAGARPTDEASKFLRGLEVLANPPDVEVGVTPCEVVYEEGRMRLLHYSPKGKPVPTPLLIVYAVINKPYILDLQPGRSVIEALQDRGINVYLIDWGIPTSSEQHLGIQDYVLGYMERAVDRIRQREGVDRVSLLGYCIGGFLATIYAALRPETVRNLLVMAAPVDFDVGGGLLHEWTKAEYFDPDLVVQAYGNVPAEFLNGGFAMLDPLGNAYLKYAGLMERADDPEFVDMFYRMEKWLGDGVPIAGRFYKEFIQGGYQQNLLVRGKLVVGGERVDLGKVSMPILVITAEKDHIVPPSSTRNLSKHASSRDVTQMTYPGGHIGLSVGADAHQDVWPKVAGWIATRSGRNGSRRQGPRRRPPGTKTATHARTQRRRRTRKR